MSATAQSGPSQDQSGRLALIRKHLHISMVASILGIPVIGYLAASSESQSAPVFLRSVPEIAYGVSYACLLLLNFIGPERGLGNRIGWGLFRVFVCLAILFVTPLLRMAVNLAEIVYGRG